MRPKDRPRKPQVAGGARKRRDGPHAARGRRDSSPTRRAEGNFDVGQDARGRQLDGWLEFDLRRGVGARGRLVWGWLPDDRPREFDFENVGGPGRRIRRAEKVWTTESVSGDRMIRAPGRVTGNDLAARSARSGACGLFCLAQTGNRTTGFVPESDYVTN
jgi:hypothetical protein